MFQTLLAGIDRKKGEYGMDGVEKPFMLVIFSHYAFRSINGVKAQSMHSREVLLIDRNVLLQ